MRREDDMMTTKKAFAMGFRHVSDLAEMNRIAEALNIDNEDEEAAALMEAWRLGTLAAKAIIDREGATLQ
jgi:hypothetical protein